MKWFKEGLNADELKKEYRELAKKYHPDLNTDPEATAIFQEINNEFDDYFTRQAVTGYSWVQQAAARYAARATRKVIVRFLTRDKESKWLFVSSVYKPIFWSWFSLKFKVIADTRTTEWKDFTGGFAACAVNIPDKTSFIFDLDSDILKAQRVPAKITPATLEEIYWYLKSCERFRTFDDSDNFYLYRTEKFGDIWVRRAVEGYGPNTPYAIMKVEYFDETLALGEAKPSASKAEYNAKNIQEVQIPTGLILHSEQLEKTDGGDIPYELFQDCTRSDFIYYHDVGSDSVSDLAKLLSVKPIQPKDVWIKDNPMIEYYAKKGIIKLFASMKNFRIHYGYFDQEKLETNMHMLSVEDVEDIQDYLDKINKEFDEHVKSLVKSGKLRIKV